MEINDYLIRIDNIGKIFNLSAEEKFMLRIAAIMEYHKSSYESIEKGIIQPKIRNGEIPIIYGLKRR